MLMPWGGIELDDALVQGFVKQHDRSLIAAAVAIIGSAK